MPNPIVDSVNFQLKDRGAPPWGSTSVSPYLVDEDFSSGLGVLAEFVSPSHAQSTTLNTGLGVSEVTYDGTLRTPATLTYTPNEALDSVHIKFRANLDPIRVGDRMGMKFCKMFGKQNENSFSSNFTLAVTYQEEVAGEHNGRMYEISMGDGTAEGGDTESTVKFLNGAVGFRSPEPTILEDSGINRDMYSSENLGWHEYEIYFKFNSGVKGVSEVPDAKVMVLIDGVVQTKAENFYNSHINTLREMREIQFFGWSEPATNGDIVNLQYDDIQIREWDGEWPL